MKVLFVFASILAAATADDVEIIDPVPVQLTTANFDSHIKFGDWFVKFYAPWCGHCKRLDPTWNDLAEEVAGTHRHVGKVDCTIEQGLCERYGVKGYPTLLRINKGRFGSYSGDRELSALKNKGWATPLTKEVPGPLSLAGEIEAFMKLLDGDLETLYSENHVRPPHHHFT